MNIITMHSLFLGIGLAFALVDLLVSMYTCTLYIISSSKQSELR